MKTVDATELTQKELKDLRVLAQFTSVYCKVHHSREREPLDSERVGTGSLRLARFPVCASCRDFLIYAIERRLRCPLDPRPA